jgi:hypothetical protein
LEGARGERGGQGFRPTGVATTAAHCAGAAGSHAIADVPVVLHASAWRLLRQRVAIQALRDSLDAKAPR